MNNYVLKTYVSRDKMKPDDLYWVFVCRETLRLLETLLKSSTYIYI